MSVQALRRGSIAASRAVGSGEPVGNVLYLDLPGTAGNYATTPDTAANSITSDIDIVMRLSMASWTAVQGFACKYIDFQQSWRFYGAGGQLQLDMSQSGSTDVGALSSVATGFSAGTTHWVRVTWRNSDDRVQFFTSDDVTNDPAAVTWTQLGTDRTLSITGIFNSTSAVTIGSTLSDGSSLRLNGHVYYFELRNGIGGTVVDKFNATAVTRTATRTPTTLVATTGETWTVNGTGWDWQT